MLETDKHIRDQSRVAKWAIALLAGGTLIWGGLVPLEGAVIGAGTVAIDGNVKKVQHQQGGIIGELLVKEGSRVKQGDVVARLDDTQARANLGVVMGDLIAQRGRVLRLLAEREDLPQLTLTPDLISTVANDPVANQVVDSEARLFNARRATREGQKAQLRERITQSANELQGLEMQLRATSEQLSIASDERKALEPLRTKGLIQRPRLTSLEREIARSEGIIGDAKARMEQAKAKMREMQALLEQVDKDRMAETHKEMRESETKIVELAERRKAAEDLLKRVDIRAPADGVIHEMAVHTVGGTVAPNETLMFVVPGPEDLVVETRIAPQDIDQVYSDQRARIRFTSFNQRVTPEVFGNVFRISPSTSRDQQTGATFYTVGLKLAAGERERMKGAVLAPGMLADTFITTTDRTALSFLIRPLSDNWIKIFAGR